MKERLWECKPEICSNGCKCTTGTASVPEPTSCLFETGYQQNWVETTKYQITETPEPVYYLDMPKDIKRVDAFLAAELEIFNGKDVKITTKHKGTYCECQFNPFNPQTKTKVSRRDWIKQKQPEPTREELQERINTTRGYITRNPDSIGSIAYGELTEILGKKEKRP